MTALPPLEIPPWDDRTGTPQGDALRPYVPSLIADWLQEIPQATYRALDGTLALVDISGFTALTERLARAGKVGAEEMSDLLSAVFTDLLTAAYDYGGRLLKWGGDGVLLLFEDDGHPERACRAAYEMRRALRRFGEVKASAGVARLRLSVGLHTGTLTFFLVGTRHRELVVAGPAATTTAMMEDTAAAGEVALSPATASAVNPRVVGDTKGPALLLRAAPQVKMQPNRRPGPGPGLDLASCLPVPIAAHLLRGTSEGEHRRIAAAFVGFSGTDDLLAAEGPDALAGALQHLIGVAQEAAYAHDVTFLGTDIAVNGGKIILIGGAPSGSGHAEEGVLRTVRAILDQPGRLPVCAGATAGRVFAGDVGPPYRRTYTVIGDQVNLAARLMARAAPWQLLATPAILDHSVSMFTATPIPLFQVKGKTHPVAAFDVGSGRFARKAILTDIPLFGREPEVTALQAALGAVRQGKGSLAEIAGEPGIGKSRLVAELVAMARNERVLSVACDQYSAQTPYAVAGALLRAVLGVPEDAAPIVAARELSAAVHQKGPQLTPWLPLLASVLGAELPPTPEVAALGDEFRRDRIEELIVDLLRLLLAGTSLLIIEDVHYADEASASVLTRMLSVVAGLPWLVVLTASPKSPVRVPEEVPVVRLALGPLSATAAHDLLVGETDDSPLPPHLLAALIQRAAGNPMSLRELLTTVGEGSDETALPGSVEEVIGAQIDGLAPADRALLCCAAVAGMSFDAGLLADVMDQSVPQQQWDRLEAFVGVTRKGGFRFRHALVRDVAYERLSYQRRRHLHGRLGKVLESQVPATATRAELALLSLHFFHARRYDEACHYSRIAAERAVAVYANAEAAEFLTRALESARRKTGASPEELARLDEALGDVRYQLGEFAAAGDHFAEARKLTSGDAVAQGRLSLKTALVAERTSGFPQALRWITTGRRALHGLADPDARTEDARLILRTAIVRWMQGDLAAAIGAGQMAKIAAERAGAREVLADVFQLLDAAEVALGNFNGEPWAERSLAIWQELDDLDGQGKVFNQLGFRAYFEGHWDSALEFYGRAREMFVRAGDDWNAAVAASNIGEVLSDQGRYAEAAKVLTPALRVFRASGAKGETAFATGLLGRLAARTGRHSEARKYLEVARASYMESGEQGQVLSCGGWIAESMVMDGRAEEAAALVAEIMASAGPDDSEADIAMLHRIRGYALAQQGQPDQAKAAFADSLDAARLRSSRYEEAITLDALIWLAGHTGQPADAGVLNARAALFGTLGVAATPDVPFAAPDRR
jgi:class 3 adenylate cyclase/tetratricopeptide (TPR) repeat protein